MPFIYTALDRSKLDIEFEKQKKTGTCPSFFCFFALAPAVAGRPAADQIGGV
ncbi:hypothetical protein Maes01_00686 [Microbulbifer aestuariivivens]|uniref:Uncharacterized protein n=1 Tax=Microbulbifer aestuariivivens TaxID=1908308 RepID=A0ABP9WLQ8_9GAMM